MHEPTQPQESTMQIRTRGAVRTRGVAPATRTREHVRTRGAVTTAAMSLRHLVTALRDQAYGSPMAVVIHGWDDVPTQQFLSHLTAMLDGEDAIWLVPADPARITEPPAAWPSAIVLDISQDTEARLYANLVVDLVFLPGGALAEVHHWQGRAEVVIVGAAFEAAAALSAPAWHNNQEVYHWSSAAPQGLVSV